MSHTDDRKVKACPGTILAESVPALLLAAVHDVLALLH